eukprot:Sspe_Gene.86459::Locus_57130_Transcript_1_1_Confidence_1.000_Length_3193::g.86459::m.86459
MEGSEGDPPKSDYESETSYECEVDDPVPLRAGQAHMLSQSAAFKLTHSTQDDHSRREKMAWQRMLLRSEVQNRVLAKREEALTKKFRALIERQQCALAEREAHLAEARRRQAKLLTDYEFGKHAMEQLQEKYEALLLETKGRSAADVVGSEKPVYTVSRTVQELMQLRVHNEDLRMRLARYGELDTETRGKILGKATLVANSVRQLRVVLQRLRFHVGMMCEVIPSFLSPGGGFVESMDEWLRSRGEEQARADLAAHVVGTSQCLADVIRQLNTSLITAPGVRGRTWREDDDLRNLVAKGREVDKGAKDIMTQAAQMGSLSQVHLPLNAAVMEAIQESAVALQGFFPRVLSEITERSKHTVAFSSTRAALNSTGLMPRSPPDQPDRPQLPHQLSPLITTPMLPAAPAFQPLDTWESRPSDSPTAASTSPTTMSWQAATARVTATELRRLREENTTLHRELLGTLEKWRDDLVKYRPVGEGEGEEPPQVDHLLEAVREALPPPPAPTSPLDNTKGPSFHDEEIDAMMKTMPPRRRSIPGILAELVRTEAKQPTDTPATAVHAPGSYRTLKGPRRRHTTSPASQPADPRPAARPGLTMEARSVKATLKELFGLVSRELSVMERTKLATLFDQAVETSRASARQNFRMVVNELNLRKMLKLSSRVTKSPQPVEAPEDTPSPDTGKAHTPSHKADEGPPHTDKEGDEKGVRDERAECGERKDDEDRPPHESECSTAGSDHPMETISVLNISRHHPEMVDASTSTPNTWLAVGGHDAGVPWRRSIPHGDHGVSLPLTRRALHAVGRSPSFVDDSPRGMQVESQVSSRRPSTPSTDDDAMSCTRRTSHLSHISHISHLSHASKVSQAVCTRAGSTRSAISISRPKHRGNLYVRQLGKEGKEGQSTPRMISTRSLVSDMHRDTCLGEAHKLSFRERPQGPLASEDLLHGEFEASQYQKVDDSIEAGSASFEDHYEGPGSGGDVFGVDCSAPKRDINPATPDESPWPGKKGKCKTRSPHSLKRASVHDVRFPRAKRRGSLSPTASTQVADGGRGQGSVGNI